MAAYYLSEGLRLSEEATIDKGTKDALEVWSWVKKSVVEKNEVKFTWTKLPIFTPRTGDELGVGGELLS